MTKNTFFAFTFFTFLILVAAWKYWAWLLWKLLRLRSQEQTFDLLAKHRFIEITGSSGKGKSWLLCHLFKHLQGVKFTNLPTPQGTYTLSKETLEVHLLGQWAAPNKWFYFLDDIDTWQKWSQQNLGASGYAALKEYLCQVGKLGGTFIWTNNGIEPEHLLKVQTNKTWKVLTYITFLNKSLLFVQANDSWYDLLPTIIPIDNKEIQGFYDPHWNIPQDYQQNWLNYIADKLKAEELREILRVIEAGGDDEAWLKDQKFNRNLLLQYLQARKKEEKIMRKKSARIKEIKESLQKYDLKTEPIKEEDLTKWDQETKQKKDKSKTIKIASEEIEVDLDQEQQEPNLEHDKKQEPNKKKKK